MGKLEIYNSIEDKEKQFKDNKSIDTSQAFDEFVDGIFERQRNSTQLFFRGANEAKYKLYTSAQRDWIENQLDQWSGGSYYEYVRQLVHNAKENKVLRNVYDQLSLTEGEKDFSILSILQHYGGPAPIIDWTYNLYIALFFGIDKMQKNINSENEIDNYFSLYVIDKIDQNKSEFINLAYENSYYKELKDLESVFEKAEEYNQIFFISDFEDFNENKTSDRLMIKKAPSLTTIYNQNIMPQKGLFILNPSGERPLEEMFNAEWKATGCLLNKFECYNINKGLEDYIAKKLNKEGIDKDYIYPDMNIQTKSIVNNTKKSFKSISNKKE